MLGGEFLKDVGQRLETALAHARTRVEEDSVMAVRLHSQYRDYHWGEDWERERDVHYAAVDTAGAALERMGNAACAADFEVAQDDFDNAQAASHRASVMVLTVETDEGTVLVYWDWRYAYTATIARAGEAGDACPFYDDYEHSELIDPERAMRRYRRSVIACSSEWEAVRRMHAERADGCLDCGM